MKETVLEKLKVLAESAKYDVSCASSGVTRRHRAGGVGSTAGWGICHSFTADGRCVSLLKIMLEHLLADIRFLQELEPHMIGVGPFLAHADTPFAEMENGSLEMTCILLGVLRLLFPKVLLPATTALATIAPDGREKGLLAGANVVMPNLSPPAVREKYALYDNKVFCGAESAQEIERLKKSVEEIGYRIVTERGDSRIGT